MRQPLPDGTLVQTRYRILRMLGQGGFGRTYLAQDTNRFNELCVLKEFDPHTQGTKHAQKAEELFAREAGVLYQLHHLQIPQFRELFRVKQPNTELLFLVQDYVAGKTYQDLIEERRQRGLAFSEKEVTQLLQDLLPVLDYIHQAGIIHRDISPDNIILREHDRKPILIDFGVVKAAANQITNQPVSQTFVGKPGYAPIEQIQKGKAEPSSDLYALAVTIVVILTGREPHSLFDPVTLTWQWQRYASVSPKFADLINRMLSAKPSDRYSSANDVLAHLSAPPPPSSPSPPLPSAPPPIPYSPVSHQKTVAVGRRRHSTVVSKIKPYSRSWVDSVFDGPAFLIKGTFNIIKRLFKLTFGLVRFTVFGILKLLFQLTLAVAAIAALIWTIPQVLPRIATSLPSLDNKPASNPPQLSAEEQKRGDTLEARCEELGMDYGELIAKANEKFYAKHPDRRGKALSASAADRKLRDEWYRIAQDILEKRASDRTSQKQVAEY
jgi:serine/threonine-protein kinase